MAGVSNSLKARFTACTEKVCGSDQKARKIKLNQTGGGIKRKRHSHAIKLKKQKSGKIKKRK